MLASVLSVAAGLIRLIVGLLSAARERMLVAMGATQERAKETARDLEIAKRQGSVMAEHRGRDDAADRLDQGEF